MNSLAAILAVAALNAPQSSPEAPPAVLPDIVVNGVPLPLEARARAFIDTVAAPFPQATLARWSGAICPAVVNLDRGLASQITDRIRAEAGALGVRVAGEGCRGNILVVATDAADLTARRLVLDAESTFRPGDSGTDLGRSALERFQTSDAAVRWWHVAMPVSDDTGKLAIALDGEAPPVVADRVVTRLRANIRYDMAWVIIVIDVTKTATVPVGDLADYVAMVSLAQIDAEADFDPYDTVLNLFQPNASPQGMTGWDQAYLRALYGVDANATSRAWQSRDMARSIAEALLLQRTPDQE
jgi:hypothetical protein